MTKSPRNSVILSNKYPSATRGKVVVWGLLASSPFGGMTWQVLHYLAGLKRLGFDVWYVEDSDRLVYSPTTYCQTLDYSANVKYLSRFMDSVGLGERWIFRPPGVQDFCLGATDLTGLVKLYKEADAVLNLCGAQELRVNHSVISRLVYLETDPVRNQVEVAKGNQQKIQELDAYDHLFTYGQNLGASDCLVPIERYLWQSTRPPVCVDWWVSVSPPPSRLALTTVANWKHRSKDVVWQGEVWHWSKDYEFRRFIDLPLLAALPLELAVGAISDDDKAQLHANGWRVISSVSIADPSAYRGYICTSLGEFTVAKEQYVRPRSGWFSDRSVCYLAAGRPVITQETGFSKVLPTGKGLFAFETMEDILAAVDAIKTDYEGNCRAAREIAMEHFAAEKVIGSMMTRMGL